MELRKFIQTTLREYLNENYSINELKHILNKLNIIDFDIDGMALNLYYNNEGGYVLVDF